LDGDATHTDVSSGTSASSAGDTPLRRSDVALTAFNEVFCDYKELSFYQTVGEHEKNLTLADLEGKIKTWNELRTSLLPRMRSQVITLIRTLDLSEDAVHPFPSPQSTANILSEINGTLGEAGTAVETLALGAPLPSESHDRNLKLFKRFRMTRIMHRTKQVIEEHLCSLFASCRSFIYMYDEEDIDVDDVAFRKKSADRREEIRLGTKNCIYLIDEILEWSELSDFETLQEEWQEISWNLHRKLVALTERLHGPISQNQDGDTSDMEHKARHRARAAQLIRAAIPMIKVARLFYDKLSNMKNIHRLPFTLDPHISTSEYDPLRTNMERFYAQLHYLVGVLCRLHKKDQKIGAKLRSLDEEITLASTFLQCSLLALAFHLVPARTSDGDGPAVLQYSNNNFKAWFFPFKQLFFLASCNLRLAAQSCFGEVTMEDSEDSGEE